MDPIINSYIDYRIRNISYSSLNTLHSCPRKYQLYKLQGKEIDQDGEVVITQNVTFAFGHVVGEGIQEYLRTGDIDKTIFKIFLTWHADLADVDEKRKKSIWLAIFAVQKFAAMRKAGLLNGYELVTYEGKPATELSFAITFPDGFIYRGFVDAVLRHTVTGKILVLELKTSSSNNVFPATFKNSAQAIGYSIVLDVLYPDYNSYDVMYLVYLTKEMEYADPLMFGKSYLQRALWIQEVLLDIETIKMYERAGVYPMRGESCYAWFRECEYFGLCTLSTKNITKPEPPPEKRKEETFQINLTLADLITAQINKSTTSIPKESE